MCSQPPPAAESPCFSLHQCLVLWLAVAVVKTTPAGTSVLDHLQHVRQERGLLKSSAASLDSTQLELSFPNSVYTLTPGNQDILIPFLDLPSEPIAFSPHLPFSSNNKSAVRRGGEENPANKSPTGSDDRELIRGLANAPKCLDKLCQTSHFTETTGAIKTAQDRAWPDTSMQDATTDTAIMETVQEATRRILSPLVDLRSGQKAYQQTMKSLLDHMAAQLLTLQQLKQVSGAFETSWMCLLHSISACDQDGNVTSDAGSAVREYLLVQPLSSPSQDLHTKHQTYLLFSQLLATLKIILQQLENRRNMMLCEKDVEMPRASQSSRLSCKAKAQARQQRACRVLEARHRRWRSDQNLAWLVALAIPLDRDCVRNMGIVQRQNMQGSNSPDLDEVTRRSEDTCRTLMTQISSFANIMPARPDCPCPSPLPSWCRDLLVKMVSSSDLMRGQSQKDKDHVAQTKKVGGNRL
ncbi:hypothetical protein KVV02_001350 [Mortierella alpina]|uniref:Uncharacterized protein n=1 Tax=Mortierella alpina TaxID=64518 RepID=A0A9P8A3Z1_MORAP|nr:hypothetical protein KVV02_001350 [Mortierella alpina]